MEKMKNRWLALYNYRDLIKQLVKKDIKLKYRRSFLGYVWSILNPLLIMCVMVLVFSKIFRFDIENYPAYLIIGQTLFSFMTESTNLAMMSISDNASLLKKVYVPKYVFTLAKVTSSMVNMLFALGAMLIVFIVTRIHFTVYMLFIPVVIVEIYLFCLGFGLFLAQAAVFFRDLQHLYGVATTAWMYLTPIFYPITQLDEGLQKFLMLCNPMCNYITQFREVALYGQLPSAGNIALGFGVGIAFMVLGAWSFYKKQDKFILYI